LTISWKVNKGTAYELTDGLGGRAFRSKEMRGEGNMAITNRRLTRFSVEVTDDSPLPKAYSLSQNYPNPFNPTTTIAYDIPANAYVEIVVFDILGRRVATLVNEQKGAGRYDVSWNGKNGDRLQASTGIYFYRLSANTFVQTRELLFLK
jgi:hypothetical protein